MIGDTARPVAMLKRKTPPTEADGETNYEKMNAVVRDSMIGYVFKEKTACARPTMGGGVLMLPPASLGVPPPHPLVGVHKTSPNMTNKNHSKTRFFLA